MSLLMDALRKAEEAKKQAESDARAQLLETEPTDSQESDADISIIDLDVDNPENSKEPVSAEPEISLEFENYPESPVAQAVSPDADITIDLEPAELTATGEQADQQGQDLELETIPFDDEIPTLVPNDQPSAEPLSTQALQQSDGPQLVTTADSPSDAIVEQPATEQQQEQAADAAVAQTHQSSDAAEMGQLLDSLLEDYHPETEVPAAPQVSPAVPDKSSGYDLTQNSQELPEESKASQQLNPQVEPEAQAVQVDNDIARAAIMERSHFSAQSIFAAKANARRAKRRRVQLAAAMTLVLTAGGAYTYNWWANNAASPLVPVATDYPMIEDLVVQAEPVIADPDIDADSLNQLQMASQTTVTQPADALFEADLPVQPESSTTTTDIAAVAPGPVQSNPELTTPTTQSLVQDPGLENSTPPSDLVAQPAVQQNSPAQSQLATAVVEPPVNFINFNRSSGQSTVIDASLQQAYRAYQSGDVTGAQRLYQSALTSQPLNRNALLGLAAIAASKNETIVALDLYSRLLSRDPTDPIARAGILDLQPAGNLQHQERELKNLISAHPGIAPLSYALGNVYASQQRWPLAQQAYFDALRQAKNSSLEPASVNPDYAYNLAISLEHLNQLASARNYYEEALQYSAYHPASFDADQVRSRMVSLTQGLAQ